MYNVADYVYLEACMEFTKDEIVSATSNFAEDQKIGSGGFGCVYVTRLRHASVAVKLLTEVNLLYY